MAPAPRYLACLIFAGPLFTADELLGMQEAKTDFDPGKAALWRKLKMVEDLPQIDQKAILHYIKTIAKNREADQKAK